MLFFEDYQSTEIKQFKPKTQPRLTEENKFTPSAQILPEENKFIPSAQILPEGHGIAQLGQNPCAEIAITGSMKCTLNPYHPFRDAAHREAYTTMLSSLKLAVEQAGGSSRHFVDNLGTMTVHGLLSALCTNNVFFVYKPHEYESDDDKEIAALMKKLY